MCGIVTLVGEEVATAQCAERMASALRHRGPDDAGAWTAPGVALAHRRLSILDLSAAGRQPFVSADGRYHMVFNGEIYNYKDVAARLGPRSWRSGTDTEVLLEAFAAWGPDCLERLSGMFAFVVWDQVEKRAFCARDRLGIKPVYYARIGRGWAIASEIGALLAAGVEAVADERTIHDFLVRDFYEHADATFFRGITKLPPAHWAWFSEGGAASSPRRYWSLADEAARVSLARDRAGRGDELVQRMQASVSGALWSDVPVGVALSGGLDSAVLLALLDRAQPKEKLEAFSFDFEDERYSERPWVQRMAEHLGHRCSYRTVTPDDVTGTLESLLERQQEPHAGAPITAYSLLFESIRRAGVIVVMDGSGIDEALGGYDRFLPARWADLESAGAGDQLEAELTAAGVATAEQRRIARVRMEAARSPSGDVGVAQDLSTSVRPECVTARLRGHGGLDVEFERPFPDALRNLMYRELRYTKLPRALRFRDRLSMAHGTELRPPFLDHTLLAYAFALPGGDVIHRGVGKALLRESVERLLPDVVRLASKRSVQTPQREWFRGALRPWVRAQVDQPSFWERGWVDREKALHALEAFEAGHGDNSFFIWQWIVLEAWARRFLDASPRASPF